MRENKGGIALSEPRTEVVQFRIETSHVLDALFITYALMLGAWVCAGLFMALAPRRFGNFVHENFVVFPAVGPNDWGKKLFLRLVGLGLLSFAARMAPKMLDLYRSFSS
jgi:hypothetical protein